MRSPRAKLLASLVSMAVIGGASFGTFAAWTDTTGNTGNAFTAGDLEITDDDGGSTSIFGAADGTLTPGETLGPKCINVENAGDLDFSSVKLYFAHSGGALADLRPQLTVRVDRSTGAAGGATFSCAGFDAAGATTIFDTTADQLPTTAGAGDNDTSGWSAGAVKSYRITATLSASAPQATESDTASLDLVWDATS